MKDKAIVSKAKMKVSDLVCTDEEIQFVLEKDKEKMPYTISRKNINYYRGYTDEGTMNVIVFMVGSPKGIVLPINYYDFQSMINGKYTSGE